MNAASERDPHYTFGRRPRAAAPFPFTLREYARLLVLRGRVRDRLLAAGDRVSARVHLRKVAPPPPPQGLCWQCARCGIATGGRRAANLPPFCATCLPHHATYQVAWEILAIAGVLDAPGR